VDLAREDKRIHAITAAMPDGTGLSGFQEVFPDRFLDVGIAESCAVDVAAGMAKAGLRPVVAIYSTFLQRAFDQVFQEAALQGLPVIFCIDRAGLVGGDGAVHHGFLDITYLRGLPGMVLMAPADEAELKAAMKLALRLDHPSAIRYPRANIPSPMGEAPPFEVGRAREMRDGSNVTLLAYGAMVAEALDAADLLSEEGIEARVINARFAKPIDAAMVRDVLTPGQAVLTIEDHSVVGGFGSAVMESALSQGLRVEWLTSLGMPADHFVPHGSRTGQLAEVGIDAAGIAAAAQQALADRAAAGQQKLARSAGMTQRP
jgi:1-deoxy-D-xylulose-5-phosphate synthase